MRIATAELVGLALLLAVVVLAVCVAVRRWLLSRAGGVDLCWRMRLTPDGTGWVFGQARYSDRGLLLYRSFSPLPFPSRVVGRTGLVLGARRNAAGAEPDLLPMGSVIVGATLDERSIELALAEATLTGLRSWLESVPPAHRGLRGGLREL